MDEQLRADLRAWLTGRDAIHELAITWPPLTKVTSHEDRPLLVPAPGIVATVQSYLEDGTLGVVGPISMPHPEHGFGSGTPGQMVSAHCDPSSLVLLEYGDITPDDVREAIGQIALGRR